MTKKEIARRRKLNQSFAYLIIANLLIMLAIMFIVVIKSAEVSQNNQIEGESNSTVYESEDHNTVTSPANASTTIIITGTSVEGAKFSRNLSENDKYLLAKIAMAEAEGESFETKIYVILTILNRVHSDNEYFPNTIQEVIFQNSGGVYQFSPIAPGGRWWNVEPNEECWKAVEVVNAMEEDISNGALYFEACEGKSWHSENLEFICQLSSTRFYK